MRNGLFVIMVTMVLCTSLLNILLLNCSSEPAGWSEDIRLTNNINSSVTPVIEVWKNYIHVIWCEKEPGPTTDYDIFYKRSTDNGRTWENIVKLINSPYNSVNPSIAVNQSTIHMVWRDDRTILSGIYYTRSMDNGTMWIPETNISTPNAGTDEVDIAIWGQKIYVVYTDYTYGINGFQLYFIKSEDNGNTWSNPKNITGKNRDSCHPRIAVNESNIHVIWLDHYDKNGQSTAGAIFYMNSTDGGLTWSEDTNLTGMGLDAAYPDIAINESTIHVVYYKEEGGIWKDHYRRSEDNGVSWSNEIIFSDPESVVYSKPKIALSSNNLHVVWPDNRDGKWELYYKYSSNNGDTWSDSIRLTYDEAGSTTHNVAATANNVDVVWRDDRNGNPEIYYKHYPVPFPPTNLTIDKRFGDDLILNWEHPQNSPSPVDHYLIYRSTTWDGFDFSLPWVNTAVDNDNGIIPLRISWNATGALLDESNHYFYIIRAVDAEGWNDTNTNIVGKYIIPMKKGWNMISLPLAQRNTSISKVLQTIDGNYEVIWVYDAKEDRWRSSTTDLTYINRTMGLWIHMKNSCNLSVLGAVPESTDIALYEGWNLVGYPTLKTRTLNGALSGINWQAVQHYDVFDLNDPWKHNSTNKPDSLNDLKTMEPGRGYWVYVTINETWTSTRMTEENKMVVWRVHGLEREAGNQYNYKAITHHPIDPGEDNYDQIDVVPVEPISRNEDNWLDFSFILLIILIAFFFAEIVLLRKK